MDNLIVIHILYILGQSPIISTSGAEICLILIVFSAFSGDFSPTEEFDCNPVRSYITINFTGVPKGSWLH